MIYSSETDDEIISMLQTNHDLGFNELLKKLKERFSKLTKRVLSRHLKYMENQKIIERYPNPPEIGKLRRIRLTESAKIQIKYNLFQGVKTKRNKKIPFKDFSKKQKKDTAIKLLIFRILRGSLRSHEDPKNGFSGEFLNGFVIDDLFESNYLGFGVKGFLFQSMKKDDVNECIGFLKDFGIIKQESFYQDKELYKISDELHGFLMDCLIVFQELIRLIESLWNYRKPRIDEKGWYGEVFGKDKLLEMVDHGIKEQRLNFENKLKDIYHYDEKAIEVQKRKEIQRSQNLIEIHTKQLDKYKYIESKNSLLWDIVMKIVNPNFLKREK